MAKKSVPRKPSPKPSMKKVARDAGTGEFVTKKYADSHKKTTEIETVKVSKPRPVSKPKKK
jgi:hypothetical protein